MPDLPPAAGAPPSLALAKAAARVPREGALPGGCLYEPKWDGYRACAVTSETGVTIWSRQGKNLTPSFPDLAAAVLEHVPPGCVIDGEAVIWTEGRLDFTALQSRQTAGKRSLPVLVKQKPATFVAFDVLAVAGHDSRDLALRDRRALLEELAAGWEPPLALSPGQQYLGGVRQWLVICT